MKKFTLIAFTLLFLSGISTMVIAQTNWDILIKGGTVIDGTGSDAFKADILIKSDSIAFIGKVNEDSVQASQTIDATGKVITPGFIDIHAHGSPSQTPEFNNFIAMGVTTIVLGQDGSSVTSDSYSEWFKEVEEIRPAVNIAALAGHGSLRIKAGLERDVEVHERDIKEMETQLKQHLADGAFGLSLGLEYVPGLYAEKEELNRLAEVVGNADGLILSHMRSEDDSRIEASITELADLGEHSKVHISHLKVVYGEGEARADEIIKLLQDYNENGVEISADTYPYAASFTGIGIVFPDWAKTESEWQQIMSENPVLLREFLVSKLAQRNGPEAILFGNGTYSGKTLAEAAESEGISPIDLLLRMGPRGASAAHFVMNEELQDKIAISKNIMISSDGSPTMSHPRGYGSFPKIIARYVIEQERLSIEQAIYKMSGLPAKTLGISDRGSIATGNKADILIFDPYKVKDRATFENPHELAEGFHWVIVNGKIAKENNVFSEERNGSVLKKQAGLKK